MADANERDGRWFEEIGRRLVGGRTEKQIYNQLNSTYLIDNL